jgi:hypothetical protein
LVVRRYRVVEPEFVLEARAAAALNLNPKVELLARRRLLLQLLQALRGA